jgi:chromosomal replication initiation ATPase DnaA
VPPVPVAKPVAIAERMQATPADNDNASGVAMPGRITVRRVLDLTAAHFGMTVEALLSPRRTQPLTRRRHVAMYVARQLTARSLPYIASKLGKKDHSTILHAVRTVQARIDAGDADTIAAVDAIVARIQATGGANV